MGHHTLRRAESADAEAVAECIDAAYSIYHDRALDLPAVSEGIASTIDKQIVWLIEVDGEVAGCMVLAFEKTHVLLENLAVHPDRSGAGLGKALMACLESEAAGSGKPLLKLSTHCRLQENIRFYERLGWSVSGTSGNKVQMSKLLPLV